MQTSKRAVIHPQTWRQPSNKRNVAVAVVLLLYSYCLKWMWSVPRNVTHVCLWTATASRELTQWCYELREVRTGFEWRCPGAQPGPHPLTVLGNLLGYMQRTHGANSPPSGSEAKYRWSSRFRPSALSQYSCVGISLHSTFTNINHMLVTWQVYTNIVNLKDLSGTSRSVDR
jgi:hypothetical protein